ncbi:MAG: hypothetical protein CBARDCOR_4197 [uncultured Caballeronia sp.]|nr:MAG: hypothetical protein CBARDCOR_4197 [uncultured Caballeronia sp.]
MSRICIIGDGSFYTLELLENFKESQISSFTNSLILYGGNSIHLQMVEYYARNALPNWLIQIANDLDTALSEADIVLHQPRYGGAASRAKGEQLATRLDLPADETLGPSGLLTAIEIAPYIENLCDVTRRVCPSASIINLTNPLNLSKSLFRLFGNSRTVGACELPELRHKQIAAQLNVNYKFLDWNYSGFNQRGFIFDQRREGKSVWNEFLDSLDQTTFSGVEFNTIESISVVPTKYFSLFCESAKFHNDRSAYLSKLRESVYQELLELPLSYPLSLKKRFMPWYKCAVVPIMEALLGVSKSLITTLNVSDTSGVTRKQFYTVGRDSLTPICMPTILQKSVSKWIKRFHVHEKCSLAT